MKILADRDGAFRAKHIFVSKQKNLEDMKTFFELVCGTMTC